MGSSRNRHSQSGFTIIELIIVLTIIAVLAILAIPRAKAIIIGGKVEPTASDVIKVVAKMRSNFANQSTTPFLNLGAPVAATAVFSNTARSLVSTLKVTGSGATASVGHDIGAPLGSMTVAQGTLIAAGDSFTVTFNSVNDAACPALATQLSRTADTVALNGVAVKSFGGGFDSGAAQNACTDNDTNTFVFTFR